MVWSLRGLDYVNTGLHLSGKPLLISRPMYCVLRFDEGDIFETQSRVVSIENAKVLRHSEIKRAKKYKELASSRSSKAGGLETPLSPPPLVRDMEQDRKT